MDLLWVWSCCHIEPTWLHPFVGLDPGDRVELVLGGESGTGLLEGCCQMSDSSGSGVEGSRGRADRISYKWG